MRIHIWGRGRLRTLGWVAGFAGLVATTALVPPSASASATVPAATVEEHPVRDTEAEALVAAAQLNRPVEVLADREEYRNVFAQPDGTLIANEHAAPVWAYSWDGWAPADPTLTVWEEQLIFPVAALNETYFSVGGEAPLATLDRGGVSLALQWPDPLPAPELDGARAVYPEVLPGVDLEVRSTVEDFSVGLVIKTPEAGTSAELRSLRIGVPAVWLDVVATEQGGVAGLDPATGNPVVVADPPLMWDSGTDAEGPAYDADWGPSDSATVAPVGLTLTDGVITLTPDQAMLTDPATSWPVQLGQNWQRTFGPRWTAVDSGRPDEAFWKFDGRRHERVGGCPQTCHSPGVRRLLYTLTTSYRNVTVLDAEFRVTARQVGGAVAREVSLYRIPGAGVGPSTTWNNQPGGTDWDTGAEWLGSRVPEGVESGCTVTNQNVAWDATDLVRQAVSERRTTTTLGLRATDEASAEPGDRFCDNGVLSVHFRRTR